MKSPSWLRALYAGRRRQTALRKSSLDHQRPQRGKPPLELERLESRDLLSAAAIPTNVLVNNPGADTTTQNTQSETAIVVAPGTNGTTNVISVFNDSGSGINNNPQFTGWAQSNDGGASFVDKGTLPSGTAGDLGDPVLAQNSSNGTIYLSTLGYNQSNIVQLFKLTLDPTTNSYTPTLMGNSAGSWSASNILDKDWLTVDNVAGAGQGTIYQAYTDFGTFGLFDNGIYVTRGTPAPDGSSISWSAPVRATGRNTQGASLAVGLDPVQLDHALYVAYLDGSSTTETIKVVRSNDGGASFSTPVTAVTLATTGTNGDLGLTSGTAGPTPGKAFDTNAFPQIAVNPGTGDLYMVYNDRGQAAGDRADVYFTMSTDGGRTWSTAVKVNDDSTTKDQWQPALAVTPDGSKVGIFWYDRRNDSTDSLINRYGTIGTVSGHSVSFPSANVQVTSTSFPAVVGQDSSIRAGYMGDYDQVAADNSYFYTTWGDNRDPAPVVGETNQPDVYFAKIPTTLAHLVFSTQPPTTTTAGDTLAAPSVEVVDQNGKLLTSDDGDTVTLTASGPGSFASGDATATVSGGVATFKNLVIDTAGNYTLSASSSKGLGGATSDSFTITPASATQLVFGQPPTDTQVNTAISPAVTVSIKDAYGNIETGDNSDTVTLTASGPGSFTTSSTPSERVVGGIATFGNVALDTVGNYTLSASSGSLPSVTSAAFNITAAPVVAYFLVSAPTSTTAGNAFSVTVTAEDSSGNRVTNYTGTVTLTSSDTNPSASGPQTHPFTASDGGVYTFNNVILVTAGSQTITANDTNAKSGSASVTVSPAAATHFVLVPSTKTPTMNQAFTITVTAEDRYNNQATGYRGTVHFTSDQKATLPRNYTYTASDNGVHVFSFVLKTTNPTTITARDTVNSSISGSYTLTATRSAQGHHFNGVPGRSFLSGGIPLATTASWQRLESPAPSVELDTWVNLLAFAGPDNASATDSSGASETASTVALDQLFVFLPEEDATGISLALEQITKHSWLG